MSINTFRRKLTKVLTSGIGQSKTEVEKPIDVQKVKNILISRPNHRLGNTLLITPLIQEVHELFPEAKIDLFLKGGVGHVVFEGYPYVDKLIMLPRKHFKDFGKYVGAWLSLRKKHYDLAINVEKHSSSGRISIQKAKADYKFFGDDSGESAADAAHIAKYPVYNFRKYVSDLGVKITNREIPTINLMLTDAEKLKGKFKLQQITNSSKPTICLFTYATGEKCFSEDWWSIFYNELVKKYPQYDFMEILPIENVSQINFAAPSFYSADIREMTAVMQNCIAFIGADSGIMHLASAAQVPVIGLFKSRSAKYGPYGNHSESIDVTDSTMDECLATVDKILKKATS